MIFPGKSCSVAGNRTQKLSEADDGPDASDEVQTNLDVEIISTFGVIVHIEDPLAMLIDIYNLLSDNGHLYIETDNLNDVLIHLDIPEFNQFFFRTAHYWYFDSTSLSNLCKLS